jgi:iron complex transport system substrate-binding protein
MARMFMIVLSTLCYLVFCIVVDAPAQEKSTLTDITGYNHTLTTNPERIISLIPSNTELLFAVGAGKTVVGVTDYCNFPPDVKNIEKIGDLMTVSVEKIVSLKPDLVLATGDNPDEVIRSLRTLGLVVFVIDPQSVEEVVEAISTVGRLTGQGKEAQIIVADIKARIGALNQILSGVSDDQRPTVFVGSPQRTENWTPGPGTFTTDIIHRAGGRNIANELKPGTWAVYSLEKIIGKNPQVILSTIRESQDVEKSRQAFITLAEGMPGWKDIDAIQNRRVALIPDDWLVRPGPRFLNALENLTKMLHPDLFEED